MGATSEDTELQLEASRFVSERWASPLENGDGNVDDAPTELFAALNDLKQIVARFDAIPEAKDGMVRSTTLMTLCYLQMSLDTLQNGLFGEPGAADASTQTGSPH